MRYFRDCISPNSGNAVVDSQQTAGFEDFHISEISTSKNCSGVVDLKYAQSYKRFANAFNHPSLK